MGNRRSWHDRRSSHRNRCWRAVVGLHSTTGCGVARRSSRGGSIETECRSPHHAERDDHHYRSRTPFIMNAPFEYSVFLVIAAILLTLRFLVPAAFHSAARLFARLAGRKWL